MFLLEIFNSDMKKNNAKRGNQKNNGCNQFQQNNGCQHVQLGGVAFYDESKCFSLRPTNRE